VVVDEVHITRRDTATMAEEEEVVEEAAAAKILTILPSINNKLLNLMIGISLRELW
jgi:hypothetical protein